MNDPVGAGRQTTTGGAEWPNSELWLRFPKAWLEAEVDGGIFDRQDLNEGSGTWAKARSLGGYPAGSLSLDCSFIPTFCGLGLSPYSLSGQSRVLSHPGSLAHPHFNSQTHSPELAIAQVEGIK